MLYLVQEQDIPIDINIGKLLEWLINRRHCSKDWHVKVLTIREKINNAIQDMPVHEEIAKLLSGSCMLHKYFTFYSVHNSIYIYYLIFILSDINYFHCLKIVEILKETEADTKNVFGRYGSQRMKDWQEILRLYEKDNLYLAEVSQILIRNVNYEIPSTKKQIQKLEQIQAVGIYYMYIVYYYIFLNNITYFYQDFEKREADHKKSENAARSEFNSLCKQLGIPGKRIKQELSEKVKELPEIYEKIAKKIKSLEKVVEFYCGFVNYTLGRQYDDGCVPMIQYIVGMLN